MRYRHALLIVALLTCVLPAAHAHEIHHSVGEGGAVIVELTGADGKPFSFESYELFRPGEAVPVQIGKTDQRGRIIFVPDSSGAWRIRAFSVDGHGADFTVDADARSRVRPAQPRSLRQYEKILIGTGCILGIFGIISLAYRKKRV
jgi:nickel transport protein